jgi:DNA polymerase-3 subunit delta
MLVKNFELKKKLTLNIDYFLLYGPNTGLINETIEKDLKPFFSKNIFRYDQLDITENEESFKETLFNKSLFEKDKLIIISQASDKILSLIEDLIEKKTENIKIILKSNILDTKSKLRKFFEKSNKTIIVPFYDDNEKTLSILAFEFFKKKKIKISNEIIYFLVQKANYSRIALYLELEKISNYALTNRTLNLDKIKKIINLSEDYNISEIVNQCLLKNKRVTISMLNDSDLLNEKGIIFVRTFLSSLKRLKSLKVNLKKEENIEKVLSAYKPAIFWKEKETVKKQLYKWSLIEIKFLTKEINDLELKLKKNTQISNYILNNFIIEKLNVSSSGF